MSTHLTASYGARADDLGPEHWLKLWQKPLSKEAQLAGLSDLTAMWYYVISGLSAHLYRASSCPATISADGVVTVPLDFYVFPSALDLSYRLSAGLGVIGPGVYDEAEKEFDLVFDQQQSRELGYLAAGIQYDFQTEAYNEMGRQIARPQVSYADGLVDLSVACTCVLRIRCRAQGYRHRITMSLTKFEPGEGEDGQINYTGYKIENLQNTIQAIWLSRGELQSEDLPLAIPPCVEDYLALCEDGSLKGAFGHLDDPRWLLFYSTCTGNELGVVKVEGK
jgi:hypothetical protein